MILIRVIGGRPEDDEQQESYSCTRETFANARLERRYAGDRNSGIEGADHVSDGRSERYGIAAGLQDQRHAALRALKDGEVDVPRPRLAQPFMRHIADDADDRRGCPRQSSYEGLSTHG